MPAITLTTDYGTSDYFVGALKGKILSVFGQANIVDISHHISAFNIQQAAYVLKNAAFQFPKGSIHLIGVDTMPQKENKFVIVEGNDHYFVGCDNGIFELIFEGKWDKAWLLKFNKETVFPGLDVLGPAAAALAKGMPVAQMADPIKQLKSYLSIQPTYDAHSIRASVIHIDHYQNAVLNVNAALFDTVGKGRKFTMKFNRNDYLDTITGPYGNVPTIEPCCFFNSAGYLQVSINKGKASTLLGLYKDDIVQIEFTEG